MFPAFFKKKKYINLRLRCYLDSDIISTYFKSSSHCRCPTRPISNQCYPIYLLKRVIVLCSEQTSFEVPYYNVKLRQISHPNISRLLKYNCSELRARVGDQDGLKHFASFFLVDELYSGQKIALPHATKMFS